VQLVQDVGDDAMICKAARVSTIGAESIYSTEAEGLIKFLMSNRHGSPFEHGLLTFRITAPLFVFYEFHRHRAGWSYNEESGRYKELEGFFYIPLSDRPLVQIGKPGAYEFVAGSDEDQAMVFEEFIHAYMEDWARYKRLLDAGIAKEVARIILPVGIYKTMYATCNPRSLMHFLSLRTKDERSSVPSYPQFEIELVARKMEQIFGDKFSITYEQFNQNGRVAP
jgi:thymidylate synthase (FAD)